MDNIGSKILALFPRLDDVTIFKDERLLANELMLASESGFPEYERCPKHIWVSGVSIWEELMKLPEK